MKKASLISLFVLTILLVGCASVATNGSGGSDESGTIIIQDLDYEYMAGLTPVGDNGVWGVGEYVDDFGNPIGTRFILCSSEGTFSNSATNGSKLHVKLLVNKSSVEIELLEYGFYPISVIGSTSSVNVKINANGETIELGKAYFSPSTKRLTIYDSLPLFKALVENPKITMLVTINDYGLSKYLFDIDSAGFEYTYHEAFVE